jgi:hypothetical protein
MQLTLTTWCERLMCSTGAFSTPAVPMSPRSYHVSHIKDNLSV